ncbi:MAG: DUF192 domain-containing protein [SAR324 cluster bacterium]|nr:DUF192 domain-containing protein [SAR324 cluster bacterium]
MIGKVGFFLCVFSLMANNALTSGWKKLLLNDLLLIRVEIARNSREQAQGLGGRDELLEGTGMLFVYTASGERIFWMKRMHIPIDILWISKGQIVSIQENVPPPSPLLVDRFLKRYGQGIEADMVLELPAGYSLQHAIQVGQPVRLIQ